jgi:hypothetical protein
MGRIGTQYGFILVRRGAVRYAVQYQTNFPTRGVLNKYNTVLSVPQQLRNGNPIDVVLSSAPATVHAKYVTCRHGPIATV